MKKNGTNGIGILGIVQIVLLTLKLTGNLNWNWFWTLSPTILPIGLLLAGIIILTVTYTILIGLGIINTDDVKKIHNKDEE
jgi:hypothetical protein